MGAGGKVMLTWFLLRYPIQTEKKEKVVEWEKFGYETAELRHSDA